MRRRLREIVEDVWTWLNCAALGRHEDVRDFSHGRMAVRCLWCDRVTVGIEVVKPQPGQVVAFTPERSTSRVRLALRRERTAGEPRRLSL